MYLVIVTKLPITFQAPAQKPFLLEKAQYRAGTAKTFP